MLKNIFVSKFISFTSGIALGSVSVLSIYAWIKNEPYSLAHPAVYLVFSIIVFSWIALSDTED